MCSTFALSALGALVLAAAGCGDDAPETAQTISVATTPAAPTEAAIAPGEQPADDGADGDRGRAGGGGSAQDEGGGGGATGSIPATPQPSTDGDAPATDDGGSGNGGGNGGGRGNDRCAAGESCDDRKPSNQHSDSDQDAGVAGEPASAADGSQSAPAPPAPPASAGVAGEAP